jgi:2-keto-4-pentenoate hydratase/2-oxohepta-3-ene-1,7-dioic acid hydratase in catechol pathway
MTSMTCIANFSVPAPRKVAYLRSDALARLRSGFLIGSGQLTHGRGHAISEGTKLTDIGNGARFALGCLHADGATEFAAVIHERSAVPLADLTGGRHTSVDTLLASWSTQFPPLAAAVDEAVRSGTWHEQGRPVAGLARLAPFRPGRIFQSGANYRAHVEQLIVAKAVEAGVTDLEPVRAAAAARMRERIQTGTPYVFTGLPSAVCGPDDDVLLPRTGKQHDWELELGVVIGDRPGTVDRTNALDAVAGYVVVNDLTTRDRVYRPDMPALGTDWLAAKNAPTFLPLGPFLVPAAFVEDPMDLQIVLDLDGQRMQDASTSDMIFDISRLLEHIESITPLQPGDLLATGSPAGNGAHYGRYLHPGDVIEARITGLGTQRNRCVQC